MATASVTWNRIALALAGALAGLCGWVLADVLPERIDSARLLLGLTTGGAAFFGALLAASGPLAVHRAALAGLALAVPAAALMTTASFRFDTVKEFLETGHPVIAVILFVMLSIPFLISGLGERRAPLDYSGLFESAWSALVRAVVAVLFTLLVWALIWLSDTLLEIVGLTIIGDALRIPVVPWLATGLALGLALAVANELSDYVSPHLPLRLLRLRLPPLLAVMVLFLGALPFRGLSGLFGGLSAGGTLMAMSLAAATLVTSAIDRDDDAAARGLIRRAAAIIAVLLPLMAALSVIAVAERVGQYGWSPDRLAAMSGAVLLTGYGFFYLLAVVRRSAWMARIRRANVVMALLVILVSALWLTPLLNPQRISAASQIARYEAGRASAASVDLWTIGREWGRAGRRALEEFAALEHPERDEMIVRLAALEVAPTRFRFETEAPPEDTAAQLAELADRLVVVPDGAVLPADTLMPHEQGELDIWLSACDRLTPAGNPGCVALVADLVPESPGLEVVLFTLVSDSYVRVTPIFAEDRRNPDQPRQPHPISGSLSTFAQADTLDRIVAGEFEIVSKQLNVLLLGGSELVILP